MRTLILQSSPQSFPPWISECLHSVEAWAEFKGYHYRHLGDRLFSYAPEFGPPLTKVTRSDLCRLRLIQIELLKGWERVVWIDSDFLIWDRYRFDLPEVTSGGAICVREMHLQETGRRSMAVNNSVLGLCDPDDAQSLIEDSVEILWAALRKNTPPAVTVIGTDYFSSRRFPLRRCYATRAALISPLSADVILSLAEAGRSHLLELSLVAGDTVAGANLCRSLRCSDGKMSALVSDLLRGPDLPLGRHRYLAPFYRGLIHAENFVERVRCWTLSRTREIRAALSGKA